MAEERARRRLAAILAADVVGYSRLMELDERSTLAVLKERRHKILNPLVAAHHGRIVKLMGDGVLVEFASALDAVECAVELQRAMAEANLGASEDRQIILRVGINLGDVMIEGGDLYGDGVNVAARIEGLTEPGEIWIAANVHDQIENKAVSLSFEDLGPREMKNIARPVRLFRVMTGLPAAKPLGDSRIARAIPSIAVLPFTNMSGDPGQDFVADGITENIIADLSRFRDLAVISRQSTFAYKGKPVKVQEVSRELGARYILEGSLQKSGDRLRITAQLIDGETGQHLWTERYDRKGDDIFTVLDEVTETIVVTLAAGYGGRLHKAWRTQPANAGQRRFQAYDYFVRGVEIEERFTKEANNEARDYFAKAIERDPGFAKALAKMAWSYTLEVVYAWGDNPAESWANALKFAKLAVERDDDEAWGHWALAGYYRFRGEADRAMAEYRRATALNPNDADVLADFAYCLSFSGKSEEGLETAHRAMRLNPHYPDWYVEGLALAHHSSRRYEESIAAMVKIRGIPTVLGYLVLAASHAALGHTADAKKAIDRALEIDPEATIARWTSFETAPYKAPADLEHLRNGLRKAGLPE